MKFVWLLMFIGVFLSMYILIKRSQTTEVNIKMRDKVSPSNRKFQVLWYNPPAFLSVYRKDIMYDCGFEKCKYSNCNLTFNKLKARSSHAVIYDGLFMPQNLGFKRPNGQIWIFAAHESPRLYNTRGNWWYRNTTYLFNWTMTYNKDNTDIFLPYGEILRRKSKVRRDFKAIARNKNKTLIFITSHCKTDSKRLQYVKLLQKYVDIEILGTCGKMWNCGKRLIHDDCFHILNTTYKFYVAFENALCHQYFTEKFYENFNYDLIMLTRGGSPGEARKLFPEGTYIATEDFTSIKHLANFLKNISVDVYARMLQQKSQYYSPGYSKVYQRALCNICERMNFMNKYTKTIKDIRKWAFGDHPCVESVDDVR